MTYRYNIRGYWFTDDLTIFTLYQVWSYYFHTLPGLVAIQTWLALKFTCQCIHPIDVEVSSHSYFYHFRSSQTSTTSTQRSMKFTKKAVKAIAFVIGTAILYKSHGNVPVVYEELVVLQEGLYNDVARKIDSNHRSLTINLGGGNCKWQVRLLSDILF